MAIATDPQSLITAATALQLARDEYTLLQMQIYLLQQIAGNTMSASALETAATQSNQLIRDSITQRQVIIYLLSQIVNIV